MKRNAVSSLADLSTSEARSFFESVFWNDDGLSYRSHRTLQPMLGMWNRLAKAQSLKVIDWGPTEQIPKEKFLGEWPLSSANDKGLAFDLPEWKKEELNKVSVPQAMLILSQGFEFLTLTKLSWP